MEQISNRLANLLGRQGIIKEDDVDICRYGLEVFLTSILEILSVMLLSLFVGNFIKTFLFFIAFIPLRIYAGGYHADTRLRCYVILLMVYSMFSMLLTILPLNIYTAFIAIEIFFSLIVVFLFAPILHCNKQLTKTEISNYRKISRCIILVQISAVLIALFIFQDSIYILAFTLGQLSVTISMLAASIKNKLKGGEKYENLKKNHY